MAHFPRSRREGTQDMPHLLCVYAHPDDEAFVAGTAIQFRERGDEVTFLCVTDGQGSLPEGGARTLRQDEMRASADVCGVHDVRFWGLEDGRVAYAYDQHELSTRLLREMMALAPTIVATFPPDGITHHPDHIALHHGTREAFRRYAAHRRDEGREEPRLYYWLNETEDFLAHFQRAFPEDIALRHGWMCERCEPTSYRNVVDVVPQKTQALMQHRSQRFIRYIRNLDETARAAFLGCEHFHRAYPMR